MKQTRGVLRPCAGTANSQTRTEEVLTTPTRPPERGLPGTSADGASTGSREADELASYRGRRERVPGASTTPPQTGSIPGESSRTKGNR
jgi:hypothetical protein